MDGYPCKSISGQNNAQASFLDTTSVTGLGFASLMKYVDYAEPKVTITENVAALTHSRAKFGNECPIDIQNKAFENKGYTRYHEVIDASHYGLSQSRSRCWAIYLKKIPEGCLPVCLFKRYVFMFRTCFVI